MEANRRPQSRLTSTTSPVTRNSRGFTDGVCQNYVDNNLSSLFLPPPESTLDLSRRPIRPVPRHTKLAISSPIAGSFVDYQFPRLDELYGRRNLISIQEAQARFYGQIDKQCHPQFRAPVKTGTQSGGVVVNERHATPATSDGRTPSSIPSLRLRSMGGSTKDLPPLPAEAYESARDYVDRPRPRSLRRPPSSKRVNTSERDWVPNINTQEGEDFNRMRSKTSYEEIEDVDSPRVGSIATAPSEVVNIQQSKRVKKPNKKTFSEHMQTDGPQQGSSTAVPQPVVLDINPSSPVDWDEIHNGVYPSGKRVLVDPTSHSNVKLPRFDSEYPSSDDLFADVGKEELSQARRQQYVVSARAKDHTNDLLHPGFGDQRPAVEQIFDCIDRQIADTNDIPDSAKPWFNTEVHRMDEQLDRERRASDGSIVIDTFPHDKYVSWRATERTDDYTIHMDHRRFSRKDQESSREQDEAAILMERLSREIRGL